MTTRMRTITRTMFELSEVTKSYGEDFVLSPLSLTIGKGETVALVGPSGSGKTTLLNILATLFKPDGGRVLINGVAADKLKPGKELSRKVGIIQQQYDLVDQLPVIHNVLAGRLGEWSFARSLLSLVVPQERHLAEEALGRVGLLEKMYQRTACLSGGEQQRVALARLLVQKPQAILADEPVSALDPARAEDLLDMLVRFACQEGQALVASVHSVEHAKRYFSRIVALRQGKIYFDRPASLVQESDLARLYALEVGTDAQAVS